MGIELGSWKTLKTNLNRIYRIDRILRGDREQELGIS
jgi:hypothetical protein